MSLDISEWLAELGLSECMATFIKNAIDICSVTALAEADLKELGLKLGHRRLFQQAAARLDGARSPAAGSGAHPGKPTATDAERRQPTVMFGDLALKGTPMRGARVGKSLQSRPCGVTRDAPSMVSGPPTPQSHASIGQRRHHETSPPVLTRSVEDAIVVVVPVVYHQSRPGYPESTDDDDQTDGQWRGATLLFAIGPTAMSSVLLRS